MIGQKKKQLPRPPRRRGTRFIPIGGFVVVAIGLAWFFESQATTTIIFVRHTDAEAVNNAGDPPLTELGRKRAALLAETLMDIDVVASVDAIYATEYRRTQQTAAPLAARLDLPVTVADSDDVEGLIARILKEHKGQITLVITHPEAIALLIAELGGSKRVPVIEPGEFDNLYIVTIPWFGKVKTLRLRYGLRWPPA